MTSWYELGSVIAEFIRSISPMTQIFFWGVMTTSVLTYTLINLADGDADPHSKHWHMVSAGIMTVFWALNTTAWFLCSTGAFPDALKWLYISDFAFALLTGIIWATQHLRWALVLTGLYLVAFTLTVFTWYGLDQIPYAILSNLVYVFQLFVVSGLVEYEPVEQVYALDREKLSADLLQPSG